MGFAICVPRKMYNALQCAIDEANESIEEFNTDPKNSYDRLNEDITGINNIETIATELHKTISPNVRRKKFVKSFVDIALQYRELLVKISETEDEDKDKAGSLMAELFSEITDYAISPKSVEKILKQVSSSNMSADTSAPAKPKSASKKKSPAKKTSESEITTIKFKPFVENDKEVSEEVKQSVRDKLEASKPDYAKESADSASKEDKESSKKEEKTNTKSTTSASKTKTDSKKKK